MQPAASLQSSDPLQGTPYRAIQRLGAGGMGEVYEAEHVLLGKRVVIKLLHPYWADDALLVDRLRLEAQVLATLDHPNLVQVVDFGQTGCRRPYFVMERLVGRTLRQEHKARGALPLLDALDLARQMLLGLGAAHARGIVHRDVKLENVFVCDPVPGLGARSRVVKVLDFGIAKLMQGAAGSRALRPLIRPTEAGMCIGTPRFFSPEQARGEAVDARSDIYSAGAVLYCLLTSHGPFDHQRGLAAVCRAHEREAPRLPSSWRAEIPGDLDAVVMRALAKRAEDRFQTADAFAAAIASTSAAIARAATPSAPEDTSGRPGARRSDTMWLPPGSPLAVPLHMPPREGGGDIAKSATPPRQAADRSPVFAGRESAQPQSPWAAERSSTGRPGDEATTLRQGPPAAGAPGADDAPTSIARTGRWPARAAVLASGAMTVALAAVLLVELAR